MTEIPRRTLPELLFLYEVEPSIKDVFVEGDYDVAVVGRFLRDIGATTVVVRSIDTVEIDDACLRCIGRDVGNRERVIFLAEQTSAVLSMEGRILCIADRDHSDWIGCLPTIRDLVLTDFSCMDAYVWSEAVVQRFLTVYCYRPRWQVAQFMEALRIPLQDMYRIRLAVRALELQLKWFNRLLCVELEEWSVAFDIREFVRRLLNKNQVLREYERVLERVEAFESVCSRDVRYGLHSQDLSRLVAWLLRRKGVRSVATDVGTVTRAMATCLSAPDLVEEPLFRRVAEFASS